MGVTAINVHECHNLQEFFSVCTFLGISLTTSIFQNSINIPAKDYNSIKFAFTTFAKTFKLHIMDENLQNTPDNAVVSVQSAHMM